MATDFQIVFDNAQSISINKRKKVSQTVSRDGTVKATSLGGQVWEFTVELPDGPKWSDYRGLIEKMEALDRVTTSTVKINNAKLNYINGYQGALTGSSLTNMVVTVSTASQPNVVTIISGGLGLTAGQYRFKAGDFIQLGTGSVYTLTSDVIHNQNLLTLHRPFIESAGTYTVTVGQNVSWNVLCVEFPQWSIVSYNQIKWSGPFKFVEVS